MKETLKSREKPSKQPQKTKDKKISKQIIKSSVTSLSKNSKAIQESIERVKLKAKRRSGVKSEPTSPVKKEPSSEVDEDDKSVNDTPQMKILREKMRIRLSKGNANKKPKIIKDIEVKKERQLTPKVCKRLTRSLGDEKVAKKGRNATSVKRNVKSTDIVKAKNQQKPSPILKKCVLPDVLKKCNKAEFGDVSKLPKIPKLSAISKTTRQNVDRNDKKVLVMTAMPQNEPIKAPKRLSNDKKAESPTKILKISRYKNDNDDISLKAEELGLTISSSSSESTVTEQDNIAKNVSKNENRIREDNVNHKLLNLHNGSLVEVLEDFNDVDTVNVLKQQELPTIYKNADERLKALRERLSLQIDMDKQVPTTTESARKFDDFHEEMEWEPIEEEKIIFEVQAVRAQLIGEDEDIQMNELPYNSNIPLPPKDTVSTFVVIDTNVLLSSIETVERVRDMTFKYHGRPIIVIPWTVIRELDFIKDDKSNSRSENLKTKSRQAIRFLYHQFSVKHPRILGQKPADVIDNRKKFAVECPDDEILQTCLQLQTKHSVAVLLSFDKNLCNKAMIHDILTLGKDDPVEKIDNWLINNRQSCKIEKDEVSECKQEISLSRDVTESSTGPRDFQTNDSTSVHPAVYIDSIYTEFKNIIAAFLSVVVSYEMKDLFGDNWINHTIIPPPWTAVTALKCAVKHWMGAVSFSFLRRASSLIKELHDQVMKLERNYDRQLMDIKAALELFHDLLQCLSDVNKYRDIYLKTQVDTEELRCRCNQTAKQQQVVCNNINNIELAGINIGEQEARAVVTFKYFENIYVYTRDLCGAMAEMLGMPCSFQYKPLPAHLRPNNAQDIKIMKSDIAGNLNKLLQVLSITLECFDKLFVNHQHINTLYHVLTTFLPEMAGELIEETLFPVDVYYCLRYKEKNLKFGVGQLQELSNHFARMAPSS